MKTKIVEHIVGNALDIIMACEAEVVNMRDKHPDAFADRLAGAGLDLACLREKLVDAKQMLDLLT